MPYDKAYKYGETEEAPYYCGRFGYYKSLLVRKLEWLQEVVIPVPSLPFYVAKTVITEEEVARRISSTSTTSLWRSVIYYIWLFHLYGSYKVKMGGI